MKSDVALIANAEAFSPRIALDERKNKTTRLRT